MIRKENDSNCFLLGEMLLSLANWVELVRHATGFATDCVLLMALANALLVFAV